MCSSDLGSGHGLPDSLAIAAKRIRAAIAAHPFMIAGTGRFDTRIVEATQGAILVKSGAEGTACAAIPAAGLGIAVKIDDGAGRAVQVAMAAVLQQFGGQALDNEARAALAEFAAPAIRNWTGLEVGAIRTAVEFRQSLGRNPA